MTLDATKVTEMGGGRNKIARFDSHRQQVDRCQGRWRAHLRAGGHHDFRQRSDRRHGPAGDAAEPA